MQLQPHCYMQLRKLPRMQQQQLALKKIIEKLWEADPDKFILAVVENLADDVKRSKGKSSEPTPSKTSAKKGASLRGIAHESK